jgi:hypothetical protein
MVPLKEKKKEERKKKRTRNAGKDAGDKGAFIY